MKKFFTILFLSAVLFAVGTVAASSFMNPAAVASEGGE